MGVLGEARFSPLCLQLSSCVGATWLLSCPLWSPLVSILECATWSSASVFSSFYLSDVQFSSSSGYGLGPLVVAGSVVRVLLAVSSR